jgi:hypothetical protein
MKFATFSAKRSMTDRHIVILLLLLMNTGLDGVPEKQQ